MKLAEVHLHHVRGAAIQRIGVGGIRLETGLEIGLVIAGDERVLFQGIPSEDLGQQGRVVVQVGQRGDEVLQRLAHGSPGDGEARPAEGRRPGRLSAHVGQAGLEAGLQVAPGAQSLRGGRHAPGLRQGLLAREGLPAWRLDHGRPHRRRGRRRGGRQRGPGAAPGKQSETAEQAAQAAGEARPELPARRGGWDHGSFLYSW